MLTLVLAMEQYEDVQAIEYSTPSAASWTSTPCRYRANTWADEDRSICKHMSVRRDQISYYAI